MLSRYVFLFEAIHVHGVGIQVLPPQQKMAKENRWMPNICPSLVESISFVYFESILKQPRNIIFKSYVFYNAPIIYIYIQYLCIVK